MYMNENGDRDTDFTLLDMEPSSGKWRVCCFSVIRIFTISKKNISEASGPIVFKFYVNHHWVGGLSA